MSANDRALREQLAALLRGGQAHAPVQEALADFPFEKTGERPHGLPYSAWELLEHMRVSLDDLISFSTDSNYQERKWPEEYWPSQSKPQSAEEWQSSCRALQANIETFVKLALDDKSNLYDTIPWGMHKETLLREILLAADHTSYHTGELIVLRRLLGIWEED